MAQDGRSRGTREAEEDIRKGLVGNAMTKVEAWVLFFAAALNKGSNAVDSAKWAAEEADRMVVQFEKRFKFDEEDKSKS